MKKLLSVLILSIFLCVSFSLTSYADKKEKECVINKDFESIEWGEKTYLPFYDKNIYFAGDDQIDLDENFEDENTENLYDYTDLYYYSEYPYILMLEYEDAKGNYKDKYFVEKSHYDNVISLINGESADNYVTDTGYYGSEYSLSAEQIDLWIKNGEKITDSTERFTDFDRHTLYSTDKGGAVRKESGLILHENDTYYLLYYKDYDRTFFYAGGSFAMDADLTVTVYKLTDSELSANLSEFYDTEPEDELDWIVSNGLPDEVFFVITLIIFVLIPLAAIIIAIIALLKKKGNNPYLLPLTVLIISAVTVIISYIIILIQLTI